MSMINAFDPSTAGDLDIETRGLIERRTQLLGPAYKLFYDRPIEIVKGRGVFLYGPNGETYLDAYNNVPCVGHSNPRVTEVVAAQLDTLNTHTRYLGRSILDYAEKLLETHVESLDRVMFTCTGSEANDLALRIARHATGADGVIVTTNAYHGVTARVAELSPSLGRGVSLGEHVRLVEPPAPAPVGNPSAGSEFAGRVKEAIADLRRRGVATAAVLMDTLFCSDGMIPEPAGFLKPVVDACHNGAALFIADEVQAGFGRTGEAMWGYQRHGIEPDLVTMGKPMGNGLPIAAVVTRRDLVDEFGGSSRYFNTFGGNPVCVAGANAVLDIIGDDHLMANASEVGGYLAKGLAELMRANPRIVGLRQCGLYVGIDVVTPEGAADEAGARTIVNRLRDAGVLIGASGPNGNALKIRPPLPFARGHADHLLEAFANVLVATEL